MLEIILGIYGLFIWLIFIKYKLLPWNTNTQMIVILIPVLGIATLIFSVNVFVPASDDVRVINKSVQIKSEDRGRVTQVFVRENQKVNIGDTLYTMDDSYYQIQKEGVMAKIVSAKAELKAKNKNIEQLYSKKETFEIQLDLAQERKISYQKLLAENACSKKDYEDRVYKVQKLKSDLHGVEAEIESIEATTLSEYNGVNVTIAELYSKFKLLEWKIEQCTKVSPTIGRVVNLQLRVGDYAGKVGPSMHIIEEAQYVMATYDQNELQKVDKGQHAEITFNSMPGKIFQANVKHIRWYSSRGQLPTGFTLPEDDQAKQLKGKYFVFFKLKEKVPNGSNGDAAIYSTPIHSFVLFRKLMIRMSSKINYLVFKGH